MVEGQLTLRGNGFASHIPHVKISVQDTGPGIPSDQVGKIFDPYFTTKETGTGLGLAIVSELVGKHRGALQVTSIVGEGTGFHVYLPLVQ
jgi:signal transduction histidine kinase